MLTSSNLRLVSLATLVLAASSVSTSVNAAPQFGQQRVDSNKFAIVASPYGGNAHQLLILKQISSVRPCWSESGARPTAINPLLTEFDFTDICGRSTDSNGYSMRVGNEDMNWRYSFQVVKENNDLVLIARPNVDRTAPKLAIARTRGLTSGFAKFFLEPGWYLAERTYEGNSLGHVYLANDQSLANLNAMAIAATLPVFPKPIVSHPVLNPITANPTIFNPGLPKPLVSNPVISNPGLPNPAISRPVGSDVIVVVEPSKTQPLISQPSPQTPPAAQPKPGQKRRSTWWQQIFGTR
jgi:N-acetylmuramoyl-L-alanine amidase